MKRNLLTLAGVLMVAGTVPVQATILLNEIHLRTPASTDTVEGDGNHEFVELRSTTGGVEACTNLWILVIENDGGGVGEIKQAWPLRDAEGNWMETGKNGLLLLGDDFNRPDSPYQFIKAPQTTMGDPPGMGPDNLSNIDALSILLVRNYTNPTALPGTTKPDIDMDNDGLGVFDWAEVPSPPPNRYTAPLWDIPIVDSVGFNGDQSSAPTIRLSYAPANLSRSNTVKGVPQVGSTTINFFPYSMARSLGNSTANVKAAWYGGKVVGTAADSVTYGADFFNLTGAPWKGLVTPGQPNLSSAPVAPVFRINEIHLEPQGKAGKSPDPANPANVAANDGRFEYIEIINTTANQAGGTNFAGSLTDYALLLVDSGGTAASLGKIREAWNLSKFATGGNGLLVIGDDYPGGYSPFAGMFDPATQLGDPDETPGTAAGTFKFSKMSMGDITNNGVTFLLVQNFTGLVGQDLDSDPGSDNDGTLNAVLPFTLTDGVSVPEILNNALVAGRGGYSTAQPDIVVSTKHYNAFNLSRIPGNSAVSSTAAWSAGVFGSNSPFGLSYRNGFNITGSGAAFRGAASPGRINYSSTAPPVAGSFLLNEVNIDPPTAPDETEYIEIISTTPHALMTNLWVVVLEATSSGSGKVKRVFDLRGQATGANRLAVFADGIEEAGSPLVRFASAKTARDDPPSYNADGSPNALPDKPGFNFTPDSIEPNNGVSVLLVAYTPTTATGVPAVPNDDLDTDNNGVLDATPWTLVDGISTGNGIGGVPVLSTPGGPPGNVSRYVKNTTANSAGAWFGGQLTGGLATSFGFSNNYFGTFKGAASPGRLNVTATPNDATALLLNEININPPGGDNNKEFVELRSANNSALSTNGYSILLVDNDGADTGRVLDAWDLDSAATGATGLLLAGHGYDTTVPWTDPGAIPEAATKLFSPEGMDLDDIGLNTDNGALTMLLVKNFTGGVGDDLDEGTAANRTLPDDHILNTPLPWDTQADSVAMKGFAIPDSDNPTYRLEGFIFPAMPATYPGTADLTVPIPASPNQARGYTPDTVARFGGNITANSAAAWYGANIEGTAATSTLYKPAPEYFPDTLNAGKVTPGQVNIFELTFDSDTDHDGVVFLMENALGMNPFVADSQKLPTPAVISANGRTQPAFTVVRPSLGKAGITYTVQASLNLRSWSLPVTLFSTLDNTPSPNFETQVWLVNEDFLPLLDVNKRVFFRLLVR